MYILFICGVHMLVLSVNMLVCVHFIEGAIGVLFACIRCSYVVFSFLSASLCLGEREGTVGRLYGAVPLVWLARPRDLWQQLSHRCIGT